LETQNFELRSTNMQEIKLPQRNENYSNTIKGTTMLLYCLSHLHETHEDMHIYKMKSVTRTRSSLRYTYMYIRNYSSTTKIKLTTTQQAGRSTEISHRHC